MGSAYCDRAGRGIRSAKSFCTLSADRIEASTDVDCPGSGEIRGCVLAGYWSSSLSARSRRRRMSESYGWALRTRLGDREAWCCGEMLSVLRLLGEGYRGEEEDMWWWEPREWGGGDEWQSHNEWRDRRDDRRGGDGEGRPASLLVMPAPEDLREGAGLLLYVRWGKWECDESRQRRRPGERDDQGRRGRVDRCRPLDEQLSLDISRQSRRERLAGGDLCRIGEGESGDVGGHQTLARYRSTDDLSRDPLCRWESLPARFEPDLCWARDASRSSEGLSCRSASGPMFSWETAGPTVDWGGASPMSFCQ